MTGPGDLPTDDQLADLLRRALAPQMLAVSQADLDASFQAARAAAAATAADPVLAAQLDQFVEPILAELADRQPEATPDPITTRYGAFADMMSVLRHPTTEEEGTTA